MFSSSFHYPFFLIPILIAVLGTSSFADEYHYRDIMVGERATGLGGAYLALSDDPSGIFHNPAGIIFSFENYFSLSANAYNFSRKTYKEVFPSENYQVESAAVVPNFFGFIQNYRKYKWGFAIVVPNSDALDQDDEVNEISSAVGASETFKRKLFRQNTTTMAGPAFAAELFKNFTIGITLFGVYRTDKAIDNQLILYNADAGGDERFFIQQVSFNQTTISLLPKIGIQYMPMPKWSLGLTLSQGFTISSELTTKVLQTTTDATTSKPDDYTYDLDADLIQTTTKGEPDDLLPLEVGFGVAYLPSKRFLISADFYYYGAQETDIQKAESTFNFSLGTEYYLTEKMAGRFGLFSNNANTPTLSKTSTNQPENINYFGFSTGLSWNNSGSSFTIGFNYAMGSGEAQAIGNNTAIHDVDALNLMAYITGSYQL